MSTTIVKEEYNVCAQHTVFYSSITHVTQADWDTIVGDQNPYLTKAYLLALEQGLGHMQFRYIQFYSAAKKPVGIAYCQIVPITSKEINIDALSEKIGGVLPKSLLGSIDLNVMICGNAFATGENGFIFSDKVDDTNAYQSVYTALDELHLREKKADHKIAITMMKEFWPSSFANAEYFKQNGCSEVNIDVNMILTLDSSWATFDDYLGAMNSKFRTKAKQVLKKSSSIQVLDLNTTEDKERSLSDVDHLYNTLLDRANFSFGRFNAKTLFGLKETLQENFYFKGYYIDNKLIGFSTATLFDDVLDGNFIGLDYDYNYEYAVYQRMLYDFIKHGIERGVKYVKIGRTAEEIKSGVGAEPVEMKFYAKHRNKVTNAILKPFVQKLQPSEFELRKPFKAEHYI